ncbi:stage III sporulation protein AE [Ruminococcus sp.]|uniref:stage III sporulation protein AE n=3 Tax=Ruminococcus sp. TaxID=41978 RepID=UPI003AB306F7
MKIFTIACFCIFSTIVCKAIEKDSREIKYAAVLTAAALVLFHSVAFVKDLISVFEDLFTLSGIDNMYLTILFKSLGICYIVQLASDYCKDCGENALASQVTLAGKLAMLSVSLPLFKAFVEIVKALLIEDLNMKKIMATVIIVLAVMFTPQGVYADSEEQNNEYYDRLISEINEGLSFEDDEDVKTVLEDNNITLEDPSSAANISASDVIKHIFESFTAALRSPLIMLGKITAATMLCVLVRSMSAEGTVDKVFTLICVLTTVLVISDTVTDSLYSVKTSMEQMNSFMMSYIPIFSSVATAGGSAAAGAGYYGVMLIICESAGILADTILVPFLSAVLAVTLVSAINPSLDLGSLAESVKKLVIWVLGIVMTLFTGLLSIQSFAGAAADNLSARAVKFAASSFIPVIGGSVSEAYSAVKGSIGVIRTSVGVIGVIIMSVIVAKPLLTLLAVKLAVWIGATINDIFGISNSGGLLKSINSVLSIGVSILAAYSIMFVISTSVVIMTAMNTGA